MPYSLMDALQQSMYQTNEDPYAITGSAIGQIAPSLINPYGSTGSNIGIGVGAALLTGLLSGLGRNHVDTQNRDLYRAFRDLNAAPDTASQDAILDQYPRLTGAATALDAVRQQNSLDLAQKQQELNLGVQSEVAKAKALAPIEQQSQLAKALMDAGYTKGPDGAITPVTVETQGADGTLTPLNPLDPVEQSGRKKAAETKAEIEAKREAYKSTGQILPPEDLAKLEIDYNTKLSTGPEAQKVLELNSRGAQVLEAIKGDDPIRAATAIYGFAKILDPTGVVRKEDGSIVADPGGPAGYLESIHNTLLQKGKLTAQTKKAMGDIVPTLVGNQYTQYKTMAQTLMEGAAAQGANREHIKLLPEPKFDTIEVKTLRDGSQVKVQRQSDGSYVEVQ